jgi:hypothetical protein
VNKDIKTKWLEALRSGEYKQGQGALQTSDKTFCCLGVLCEVQGINSRLTGGYAFESAPVVVYDFEADRRSGSTVYAEEYESAGLSNRAIHELIEQNDNGKSFIEIAGFIEEKC